LQSSLIQIANHMSVTKNEIATATAACDRVQNDMSQRLGEVDANLRGLEETLSVGNAENRNQMMELQEEIARIHESLGSVSSEFADHKRATNSVHNKLQSQVWALEEGRKRAVGLRADAITKSDMPLPSSRGSEVMSMRTTVSPEPPATISSQATQLYTVTGQPTQQSWPAFPSGSSATIAAAPSQPAGIGQTVEASAGPMRSALAPSDAMSAAMMPQQLLMSPQGSTLMPPSAVITPALQTRIMARPPVGIASPQALR